MSGATIRALVGSRVSHVQGDEKTSHIDQHAVGVRYCQQQGWSVAGSFEDLDVSALSTSPWGRPDLGPWLKDRADQWDALVVAKTDRLFRSAKDCVDLAHWAEQNRKILVIVEDGLTLDYLHENQDPFAAAMAKIFLILASVFAEIEGRRFVQRARSRVRALRPTDRWGYGIPPYGFRVVDHPTGKGKALDHDPEMVAVLRRVADAILSGDWSWSSLVVDLNSRGVLSPQDHRRLLKSKPATGTRWTVNKLQRIMTSPATQGVKLASGRPVLTEDGVPVLVGPPVFDANDWQRIQTAIEGRAVGPVKRRDTINPMLGVGVCGGCGKSLSYREKTTPGGVTHRYYVCGNSPRPCRNGSMRADEADEILAQTFLELRGDRQVLRRVFVPGDDSARELDDVRQTIDALREDRALGLYDGDDEVVFRRQMKALLARRDDLVKKSTQPSGWVAEETGSTYRDVWDSTGPDERRKMLIDAGVRFVMHDRNRWETLVP